MLSKHLFYFAYVGAISPLLFILTARSATTFFLIVPLFLVHVAACLQLDLLVDKDRRDLERDDEEDEEEEGSQCSHAEAIRTLDRCVADLRKTYPEAYRQEASRGRLFVSGSLAKAAWPQGVPPEYQSHEVTVVWDGGVHGTITWLTSPDPDGKGTDDGDDDEEDEGDGGEARPDASGSYPVSEIRGVERIAPEKG